MKQWLDDLGFIVVVILALTVQFIVNTLVQIEQAIRRLIKR